MKNTFGNNISVTLFGESHGKEIGAVLDGVAAGVKIDENYIASKLALRRPSGIISTARREEDKFHIVSGVFNGYATGTPICILIENADTHSSDYSETRFIARPGHADYTAFIKYHGFEDYRGGGHFSGRLTAPIVAAGAIAQSMLESQGIYLGTHILRCAGIADREFDNLKEDIESLSSRDFAVLDEKAGEKMKVEIMKAANDGDSVGGIIETAVAGIPAGVGEPWFDSVESILSHILFSIPAVKGVEFGCGFAFADKRGSEANDPFEIKNGSVTTKTNNNGGINGGITNGMPIVFRCVIKPTPSIYKEQNTVDFKENKDTLLKIKGRHDPAILHRARVVADSVTALALSDLLAARDGTEYFGGGNEE